MLYLWNLLQSQIEVREEGQGMVEYALIIVLVAILLVVALTAMKDGIAAAFTDITTALGAR